MLQLTTEAHALANIDLAEAVLGEKMFVDAQHIAIATVARVDVLVSWNFKHIVNAIVRATIERICRDAGFEPPIICTPEELLET